MAVNLPTSDASRLARDVLNVVVAPSSRVVLRSVLDMLRNLDRGQWYASLMIEGGDDAPDRFALAQAARDIGVPVMSVRTREGSNPASRLRMFLDEWFLVRNAHASIVHVHSPAPLTWSEPAHWIRRVMPRLPFVISVYGDRDGPRADAPIYAHGNWRVAAAGVADVPQVDVSRLYEAALATTGGG